MLNNRSGNLYYCIYYIMKGIIIIKQSYHYVNFVMRTLSGEFPFVVIKKYVYKNFLGPKIRSEIQQDCRIQPDNRRYS